jgi:hypothetical protein
VYEIPSLRLMANFKDSSFDCSPRWVDTTIHQLAYSRREGDHGKQIRKALFRFLKCASFHLLCIMQSHVDGSHRWHRTRPWKSEYFDWYECKLMPRFSINPRSKSHPRTVGHLLSLTKLRTLDRPAERRTWDEGKTYFVLQDPFDYHVVRPVVVFPLSVC